VGAVVAAVSYFMVTSALTKLKNTELKPTETVDSIKEDAKWLKNQLSDTMRTVSTRYHEQRVRGRRTIRSCSATAKT
jgi:hypothetical protein